MINRYLGDDNRRNRIEQLKHQKLVFGNQEIAEKLESLGAIEQIQANKKLIEEGGTDNDVYFILSGSMMVFVKGNFVAKRFAGDHVGEMVAINPESRRTATVKAIEDTIVLKISQSDFSNLLDQYPLMYKPIAKTLAKRLDDRKNLLKPVRDKIKVFIISSAEQLTITRALENAFDHDSFIVKAWPNGVFRISSYPLDDLIRELDDCDFAIAVAHGDDVVTTRNETWPSPRDNVVFELGLAMGKLGRERAFLLEPRHGDVRLPSDLAGVTTITYKYEVDCDLGAALSPACNQIRDMIKKLGVRPIYL